MNNRTGLVEGLYFNLKSSANVVERTTNRTQIRVVAMVGSLFGPGLDELDTETVRHPLPCRCSVELVLHLMPSEMLEVPNSDCMVTITVLRQ